MYEVMDSSFRGIKDNVAMYRVEIVVDTANDLPEPLSFWTAGSMAIVADTQEIKILSNKGEWE